MFEFIKKIKKDVKKSKTLMKFLGTNEVPKVSYLFFSFKNGNTYVVATKDELEGFFVGRFSRSYEKEWIYKKAKFYNGYYIFLFSTNKYYIRDLITKKDFFYAIEKDSNILVHCPHEEIAIPLEFEKDYCLDEKELIEEALRMADYRVGDYFCYETLDHSYLHFNYSRIFLDVERFKDDSKEEMSKVGMGMCYTSTSDKRLLRHLPKNTKEFCEKIYDKYHQTLKDMSQKLVDKYQEKAIIIDLHSFDNEKRWYEPDGRRHDICIGFDESNLRDKKNAEKIKNIFDKYGFKTLFNEPFKGAIKPFGVDISSVMIEVNRKLYLDENYNTIENENLKQAMREVFNEINISS